LKYCEISAPRNSAGDSREHHQDKLKTIQLLIEE